MKKRILYIGGFDLPDKNAAAQRVIANAKLFRDLGYEIILVGLDKNIHETEEFVYEEFRCFNLVYPKTRLDWMKYLCSKSLYLDYIERFSPNIIIAYNHPAVALRNLLRYTKKNNIKLLSDCTEWYEPQGNFIFRQIKGFDIWYRMRIVHPQLDGLIVISSFLYNYYKQQNVKALLQLPPLVDKKEDKWIEAAKHKEIEETINFIYAGSPGLGNKDRLDMIISAMDKAISQYNLSWKLTIIGIAEDIYRKIYKINKQIPSFVVFKGRRTHKEVLQHLMNSDFQIFIRENNLANTAGFPTKFVESQSSGLMVLTNHSSDLKDFLLEDKNGYLLDISSEETLNESILRISKFKKNDILLKKKYIDTEVFDYRKYSNKARLFLGELNS